MSQTVLIVLIWVGTFSIAGVVGAVLIIKNKIKESQAFATRFNDTKLARLKWYRSNPLLCDDVERILSSYRMGGFGTEEEILLATVSTFEAALIPKILFPIVGFIVGRNLIIAMLFFFIGTVIYDTKINSAYSKMQVEITEELAVCTDQIDRNVLQYGSIAEAVRKLEPSKRLKVPFGEILASLTKPNGKARLDSFLARYPNPLMCTIASCLYIRMNAGNPILPTGETALTRDLSIIEDECNDDVQYNTRLRTSFKSLAFAPLVSLAVWPLCEFFILTEVPGTTKMINGTYGFVAHTIIILVTLLVYKIITNKMRTDVCTTSDRKTFIDGLLDIPVLRDFAESMTPKNGKKYEKLQQKLHKALSTRDMTHVWMEKIFYFSVGFVLSMVLLLLNMVYTKTSMSNNYSSLSIMPMTVTQQQMKQMKSLDKYVLDLSESEWEELTAEDASLKSLIKSRVSGLSSGDLDNQVSRVKAKREAYYGSSYKWWWWLIALAVAIALSYIPDIELWQRKSAVEAYIQREITQLQTLAIVLGDADISTYQFVCWLEKQAVLYKPVFAKVHYNYNTPLQSLQKSKIGQPREFRRLIDRLCSTVGSLTLEEAFRSMTVEKRSSLAERKIIREAKLNSDAVTARLIAIAPPLLTLILTMVAPMLVFGLSSLTGATSGFNAI